MSIWVWRLSDDRFAATMWSGVGSRVAGGRWNGKGVAVTYAAGSKPLAALEQLVHLARPRVLSGYVFAGMELADAQVERIDPATSPPGWDSHVAALGTRVIGDAWSASGRTLALAVPSVVVPGETNYLINPAHADFASAARTPPQPYAHDPRLK